MRSTRIAPVLIALGIAAALLIALFPIGQSQPATAGTSAETQAISAAERISAERASRSLVRSPAPTLKPTPKPKPVVRKTAKPKPVVHKNVHKAVRKSVAVPGTKGAAQRYARTLVSSGQWGCLRDLWQRESGWGVTAGSTSRAYGIPQALPGSKMKSAGADWRTNYKTQIKWGLGYIENRYGSPCKAWSHFLNNSPHWY